MTDLLQPADIGPGGGSVSRVGLGTARLGAFWQRRSLKDGARAIAEALDAGITLIDTADVYARGISERLVGRAVGTREDVVVMTKVGLLKTPNAMLTARRAGSVATTGDMTQGFTRGDGAPRCFAERYVRIAAQRCLRRQRRSALDVLLLHEPGPDDLRRADFLPALERLTARGDVRHWGASVRSAEAAMAALDLPGLSWLQLPVSLADTRIVDTVRTHPRASEVAMIGLAVLGDGSLLARARQARPDCSTATLVAALASGAAAHHPVDAVLLGMSSAHHVQENVAALREGVAPTLVEELRTRLAGEEPA